MTDHQPDQSPEQRKFAELLTKATPMRTPFASESVEDLAPSDAYALTLIADPTHRTGPRAGATTELRGVKYHTHLYLMPGEQNHYGWEVPAQTVARLTQMGFAVQITGPERKTPGLPIYDVNGTTVALELTPRGVNFLRQCGVKVD